MTTISQNLSYYGPGTFMSASLGFCSGYILGTLIEANAILTAQVFMVATVASYIFTKVAELNKEDEKVLLNLRDLIAFPAFVFYLNKLDIISKNTTIILVSSAVGITIISALFTK